MGYEKSVEDTVRYFLQRLDELFIKTGVACPLDKWLQWCEISKVSHVAVRPS